MKLSVEAKVAAAVAAGLMVMTSGAMAQGRHKGQTGGRNDLGPTNNSGVQMHMSQQESSKSSLFDSTNAEENRQKFSDKNVTSSLPQQVTSNVSQQGTSNVPQQGEDRQKARQKA